MTNSIHQPVLLSEIVEGLGLQTGETLVDCTVNRGGHSTALCPALGKEGRLLAIDQDGKALAAAKTKLKSCPGQVSLVESNFRHLTKVAKQEGVKRADAVLFDLGLSSEQLADPDLGFSFNQDGPLKMSFSDQGGKDGVTADDVVNNWSEQNLTTIIDGFGEESFAGKIAEHIVATRRFQTIETTGQLVEVIRQALPGWYKEKQRPRHFATKTFQAIRMAVNDELGAIKEGLEAAWQLLAPGGRLAVISFHSLEAREVKRFFQAKVKVGEGEWQPRKAIKPTRAEILQNPRSRSAQLRIINRVSK
ncbi:MAG: 16S rRNA (cytosine(1402)-N(4))-methyltransferase RsmH [Patescibacteria group bacterium]|nr:16S rRNA (cytosine(1402)-N(4))-methyltransferase RsmH [Patescibacteria group bacterium]